MAESKGKIVIALGGNALQSGKGPATAEAQLEVVKNTCKRVAEISGMGYEIAVVHGNGPQVGRIVMASEAAKDVTPSMPFDVCGAMSQGYIGYHIQQCLRYALNMQNRHVPVVTVATQVVVDENDPAFQNPTKPIGPFYTEEEAKELEKEKGWTMKEDAGRGWRRVVASPKPVRIVEIDSVKQLWEDNIVITCGGGGIPVLERMDGQDLDHMTLLDGVKYIEEGQFPAGSMLPKVEAAMKFVRQFPSKKAIITSLDKAVDALEGKTGTVITFN